MEEEMPIETPQKLRQLASNFHFRDWRIRPQPSAANYFSVLEAEVNTLCSDLPLTPRRIFCYANYVSDHYLGL
jgi:hypothetical protein